MLLLVLRGLTAARRRLAATGLAVALGVALASGAMVLGRAIERDLAGSAAAPAQAADVVVRQRVALRSALGPVRARLDTAVADTVRATPGAGAVDGVVQGFAQAMGADGLPLPGPGPAPARMGLGWPSEDALNPWRLVRGRSPSGPGEVVVDAGTARRAGLEVGQPLDVSLPEGRQRYRLVGVAALAHRDAPAATSVVLFQRDEAARRLGAGDQVDMVLADAAGGVDAALLAQRLRAALPPDVEVLTADQLDRVERAELDRGLAWLRGVLASFVAVALVAAGLLIANTFNVLVAQRARELALLRALGAHRRQVAALALGEAAGVGLLGSVAGVALGVALARLLAPVLTAFGWDTSAWSLEPSWAAVLGPAALGVVVTLAGAARPAWLASRASPLAAAREAAAEPPRPNRARGVAGLVVLAVGLLVLASAASWGAPGLVLGASAGLVGLGLAGPLLARPAARLVGLRGVGMALAAAGGALVVVAAGLALGSLADRFAPGLAAAGVLAVAAAALVVGGRSALGTAGAIARGALAREPRRVATTAGSLVVGVGVASTLLVLACSVRSGVAQAVTGTFRGDFVVVDGRSGTLGGTAGGLPPQLARDVAAVPGVDVASGVQVAQVAVDGEAQAVPAVDAATLAPIFDVGLDRGSVDDLGADGLAVQVDRAQAEGWELGDVVTVSFPTTGPEPFRLVALYRNGDLAGDLLLGVEALARRQAGPSDVQVFVGLDPAADPSRLRAELADVVARYPSARLLDPGEYRREQEARVDRVLQLALALVALAVVIAVVGVANTLALVTLERRRELALLRAVGASAGQVRAVVRWEAVVVALVGSVTGVVVGLVVAWSTLRALGEGGYRQLAVPWWQLMGVVLAAGLAGVAAAAMPARRASRVDVVRALASDG